MAQCWISAFIKDFVVHPGWRRRGLGAALMLHTLNVFQARGAAAVTLKVKTANSTAFRLYERMGMTPV